MQLLERGDHLIQVSFTVIGEISSRTLLRGCLIEGNQFNRGLLNIRLTVFSMKGSEYCLLQVSTIPFISPCKNIIES